MLPQVRHSIYETQGGCAVARVQAPGDDCSRPAADSRQHSDVLLAVGAAIRHRLADDARSCFELPEEVSVVRVQGFEPTIHRSVEHNVSGRYYRAAPGRKLFFYFPDRLAIDRIPGRELSAIAARPGVHTHVGADVRRSGDVI